MRTNIEIDDELIAKAMKALNVTTKREAVAKALESVVMDAERVERQVLMRKWRGKLAWEGNLEEWRKD